MYCFIRSTCTPLFAIELEIAKEGISFSTPLENFVSILVGVFDKGIEVTQHVAQLEPVSNFPMGVCMQGRVISADWSW